MYRRLKILASVIFVLAAFSLSTSCTTSKHYEGPDLSEDEIAIVRTDTFYFVGPRSMSMYFRAVDGVAIGGATNEVLVMPGPHTFKVWLSTSAPIPIFVTDTSTVLGVISFEAMAGHRYEIIMRSVHIWVEDLETGEIVMGTRPS